MAAGSLDGRVALVTAAAAGIGAATARHLAAAGAHLALVDSNGDGLRQAAAELDHRGVDVLWIEGDVTRENCVQQTVDTVVARYGRLDILVNAVGGYDRPRTVQETSLAQWVSGLTLNVTSTFLCSKAAIPHLIRSDSGRIINISSEVARTQVHFTAPEYAAGKAAVLALTRYLARELGPHGVTVNAVTPGPTWSPRARRTWNEEQIQHIIETTPLRRIADPDDVAAVIAFLASPDARHVTGATIDVTGGHILV